MNPSSSNTDPTVNGRRSPTSLLSSPATYFSFAHNKHQPPLFSLPTLLFVALVSFLLGSLFRSLLSPADFIAFLPLDGTTEDELVLAIGGGVVAGERGWRELRRLLEIKGIWGGEDLMVGVVRR